MIAEIDRFLGGVDSTLEAVRQVEKALGSPSLTRSPKMEEEAHASSRSLYVARSVRKGDLITADNVRSVRPVQGLHPKY